MKKLILKITVALLSFAIGVAITLVRLSFSQAPTQKFTTSYEKGKIQAARDIADGRLIIKLYGGPMDCYIQYKMILAEGYNIELMPLGYSVSDELEENVHGYNEVQQAEIERRYGKGILENVERQARQVYDSVTSNANESNQ